MASSREAWENSSTMTKAYSDQTINEKIGINYRYNIIIYVELTT